MDLNENGSLVVLEHLMEEFFNPLTNNVRKHEIELQLDSFKRLPQMWKFCVHFVTHTSSQYVIMFALSILESVINQQWSTIDWSSKEIIKNVLHNNLIEKGDTVPHFLRSKYAKLLVDIAKQDWPDRYPNFFLNILELLRSEPNQLVGLILLRTTSEEFMGLHSTFESSRREEITRLLQQYIPVVFELLTNILDNLSTKPRHTTTATPPPSPTHSASILNVSQQLVTATFRPGSKALNKEILDTIQHLFTWVSIKQIPSHIIKAIFLNFTNISTYAQDDDDVCVLAISTINELLYRKCTPPESQDFFVQLYQHTVELLKDITNSSSYRIDTLDSVFVDKLSELLVLLTEQHLWRLELEPSFSALEFLSSLFQLTMQLPIVQCYLRCLAVWAAFIKQIKPQNAHKYSEVFLGLTSALLKKIQFTYNYTQLNQINNTDYDEDDETEWQSFLRNSIEIIAMVAEYTPVETFNQVLIPWKICHDIYQHMEHAVDHQNYGLNFEIAETERLCYVLKDFSSLTQTLARLSSLFIDQENEDVSKTAAPLINSLIDKLLESASLASSVRFYMLKLRDSRLTDCFIDIHSQLLAALKTWLIWMTQKEKMSDHNIKIIVDTTLPVLLDGANIPTKISHSAAHLLLCFANIVFAPIVVCLPMVVQFIHVAPNLRFTDRQINCVVNSSVSNLLLKPWGDLTHDDSARRNMLIGIFFENLTKQFRELSPDSSEARALDIVNNVLPSLSNIVEHCKNFPMASKKLLYSAIKPTIEHALYLFPSYVKFTSINNHLLAFFVSILGTLQQQLGVEGTKSSVQIFLQVAVSGQQTNNLAGLDKLLQILQLVVESPGTAYKTFLPGILQLCMENVYPLIASQNDAPDVFVALLSLLYSILLHRWQYFYISQVRLGYSPGCSEIEGGPDQPQKPEQLLAVLQVFGQALLQQDINIFRLSLAALEDLNSKWKLYHKMLFRDHLLPKFLTVLLTCLIDKSQTLLSEDIHIAVYNMAAVNFEGFFSTFLRQFIQNLDGITPHQWEMLLRNFVNNHDRDMPTFVHHLQRFITEAQHYKVCNMNSTIN